MMLPVQLFDTDCRDHAWLNHAFLVIDDSGTICFANRRCEEMLGYVAGELDGQSVENLVPPPERGNHPVLRQRFFKESAPRAMNSNRAVAALKRDGTTIQVIIALSKFYKQRTPFVMAQLFLCDPEMFDQHSSEATR